MMNVPYIFEKTVCTAVAGYIVVYKRQLDQDGWVMLLKLPFSVLTFFPLISITEEY